MKKKCRSIHFFKRISVIYLLLALLFISGAPAQFRNYSIVYTDNARGNIAMFGNTLMAIVDGVSINTTKMNDNAADGNSIYGNDFENMQYVDVDGNSFAGLGTRNSSTANFILPAGNNIIKLARLYWGGRVKDSEFDLSLPANKKIKIRKGNFFPYTEFAAIQIDKNNFIQNNEAYTRYQAFADITSFIQNTGAGSYTVANAPLSTGAIENGGNYGGWCIVIVYENASFSYNSIRLYDGFEEVFGNGNPLTTSVTLTGLNVPSGPLAASDAKMGVVTWEGDANLTGDFLRINGNTFSNNINPANNPWNGTISDNGINITSKNPDYTNQMGIDIDQFEVGSGYGILPNATTATLEFGTEADQYFPGIFGFVIKTKEPVITLDKVVTDCNNNHNAEAGEILTYALKGTNLGAGNANNVVVTDTLPNTVTYVLNSLNIITSPGITAGMQTDITGDDVAEYIQKGSVNTIVFRLGTGADANKGGTLASNEFYEVQFKVMVNNPGTGKPVPAIINTARVQAFSDANVMYTDDGTAIINPEAGAFPLVLLYFNTSLQNRKVNISWSTSMEINCKQFDVEQSVDGITFSTVKTIPGNGTTSWQHKYSTEDEIKSNTSSLVYYRLKQVNVDEKSSYSPVNTVLVKTMPRTQLVSPNPFFNQLHFTVDWNHNELVTVKILNASATEVLRRQVKLNNGSNYFEIENLQNLPAGNYFIEIASSTNKISQKILKQ